MAGAAAAGRERNALFMFIGVLLIPAILGSSKTIFNDGDVSWHIATGQWIIAHRSIPQFDPFSFTWAGKPWVPIEWLAEVAYALAYRLLGYSGVAALVTAALIALHAIVYANSVRSMRAAPALGTLVLMDLVLVPMLLARPHLLTWPLLALWTVLMLKARDEDRAPPFAAALLMVLWANIHGSFVVGLLITAAFGLEALFAAQDKARTFRQWLAFGLASLAAVFVNGNGIAGVLQPLKFTQFQMLPLIDEWKPSSPEVTPIFFGVLFVVVALILWKRPRLSAVRWLILAGFLGLALLQVRHQAVLAILAAMILPTGAACSEQHALFDRPLKFALAAAGALLVIIRSQMPLEPPENGANPWNLIAAVPPSLRAERVLNGYSMGGPLILSGIRPFVDGRGDMYGDALVLNYARIVHGDAKAFAATVNQWDIRWAIVPNESKQLIQLLDRSPAWRRIVSDKVGAIYVRAN